MAEQHISRGEEVLERFSRMAELDRSDSTKTAAERATLALEITDLALGHVSIVRELGKPSYFDHPIERFSLMNPRVQGTVIAVKKLNQAFGLDPNQGLTTIDTRSYPSSGWRRYGAADFLTFRRQLKGDVVGVDAGRSSLVLRQKSLITLPDDERWSHGSRYWAHMVDEDGQPLVDLTFQD